MGGHDFIHSPDHEIDPASQPDTYEGYDLLFPDPETNHRGWEDIPILTNADITPDGAHALPRLQ